jgi:DNA-binding NarL/FixJ family response regulator
MEDPAAVAHSLNRLGNWMMNSGQPVAALDYHREALELFEELDDQAGIATTLDLLAMTSNQCGDAVATVAYYERAVPILRALNDRQTLASSLTMLSLYKLDEALGREAIALARAIEWRSGEAYALSYLGSLLAYKGDLGQGLRVAASGRSLAEVIDHRLWLSWAEIVLGLIYLELLAPEEARRHLLPARDLAQEVGSTFMIDFADGLLASTYLMLGRRDEAAALLPVQMVGEIVGGQYTLAKAFVEQALADDDPLQALQRLDQLTLPAQAHWLGGITTFYGGLVALRAEALRRLARLDEAEAELQAMVALYQEQGTHAGLWRLHVGLGKVYQDQGNAARAEAAFAAARARIAALADTVPDEALREQFRRRAHDQIPPVRPLTPRQAAKVKYGGLTRREREVAAIVAGGLTNQEIADDLVVSIKTVEAHVTRILSKLGFSSRAQIAAWAVDKGLASAPQDLDSLTRDDRSESHDAVP